ncbi:penicillin-binding transpeptidase domain-containing protein [Streptomyces litchfieldiae]|uniref:Penicillin-binding transpeptidase domain-containing protein n=1 Tax=Streptomyces litchfieldiae TaxID=3075543 RepID=A0ABU2MZB7_9ACTN|nr:penicillin-binding transpeptidase domain-containing protein [Streptomyces sp. DSM 44938]MDT0346998.1 penicillin-binding transpeptidase domain-containing protein [Streptomyces sp. DSM 44938]
MRNGQRIAVIGGVCAAVVSVVGFGAFSLLGGDGAGDGTGSVANAADGEPGDAEPTVETGPPTAEEVLETSGAFLTAWADGDVATAAGLTDDPDAARAVLEALPTGAAVDALTLAPGTPEGADVPFGVEAVIAYEEEDPAELAYDSELTVVRDTETGEAVVDWEPTVVHPGLTEGGTIETGPVSELPPVEVLDKNGAELTAEEFPGLAPVLTELRERYGEQAGGSTGAEVRLVDAEGATVTQLVELSEPSAGQVPTTIDPALQRAAEAAVADSERASVVAVQPSTGAIQAIANAPADGFDIALEGSYAPGSTFKIVTASLLIDRGLASANEAHPCPKYFEHGGWRFQNLDEFEIENGTFADSFAASCNTAFISQAPELADDDLGNHARDVFGLGLDWQVGATSMDGAVPTQSDAQMAASLIGQGGVRMNPLTMASVSATVKNGSFLQPYLVPADFDDRQLAQAPGSLSAEAAAELRGLMNRTALSGTAAAAMSGIGGDIGAKTGSAEVDGQEKPNAWFTAYRNDLAVAAVVPDSGHGGEFAGPIVAEVLRAAP